VEEFTLPWRSQDGLERLTLAHPVSRFGPLQHLKIEGRFTCPVHRSLYPDVEKVVTFVYEDEEVRG
jgi:hypothetical protein